MSLDFKLDRVQCTNVFYENITHNLSKMATEAGVYDALWEPRKHGYVVAEQIIPILKTGLTLLKTDPERFKKFDAPNGWGTYKNLVDAVESILKSCEQYPDARIRVSV